jgi:hypothetical protein
MHNTNYTSLFKHAQNHSNAESQKDPGFYCTIFQAPFPRVVKFDRGFPCLSNPSEPAAAPPSTNNTSSSDLENLASAVATVVQDSTASAEHIQYVMAEWEPAFLRQARGFLFFLLLPREASKRVPTFDRGTGSKPEMLRSGSLQADLSLII